MSEEVKVLVVDDEKTALKYIEYIISSIGYSALSAASRSECLEVVRDKKPDVIILDIMLGDSNGFDVCREIKADPENSDPIIVMYSGVNFSSRERNRGLEAGIDGYLNKSASGEEVKLTIQLYARIRTSEKKLKDSERELRGYADKVRHLNTILTALRNVNKVLMVEKSPHIMLKRACESLTGTHGYHTAWLGLLGKDDEFEFMAESGLGQAFELVQDKRFLNEFPFCVQEALSKKDILIISERRAECRECPLYYLHETSGALSVQISHDSVVFGFLSVSIPLNLLHENEEQNLLKAVASDIGIALHNISTSQQVLRLTNIVRTIPQPISFVSDDYRYVAVNDIYSELFGLPVDGIIGRRVEDFIGADLFNNTVREKMDLCLSGEKVSFEAQINYKLRGRRWMIVEYQPFYNPADDKNYIISIALDITDRKINEIELARQMKELEIFNEASINRELIVNELRAEVNSLLLRCGENPKYRIIK